MPARGSTRLQPRVALWNCRKRGARTPTSKGNDAMSPRGLVLMLVICASALGCAAGGKKGSDRPSYSVTLKVAEKLKKVRELADKKEYEEALAALDQIAESKYLNPLEQAVIWSSRAGLHLATNKSE